MSFTAESPINSLTSTTCYNLNIAKLNYKENHKSKFSDLITRVQYLKTGLMAMDDLIISTAIWIFLSFITMIRPAHSRNINKSVKQFKDHSCYALFGIVFGFAGVFVPSWSIRHSEEILLGY